MYVMEKFYFKSYDRTVGSAGNLEELKSEMSRLSREYPGSVDYHLREGHIASWLNYIGEKDAAESLSGVTDAATALKRLGATGGQGGRRGQMKGGRGMHHPGRPKMHMMESDTQK